MRDEMIDRYVELVRASNRHEDSGEDDLADECLDKCDELWYQFTPEELAECRVRLRE